MSTLSGGVYKVSCLVKSRLKFEGRGYEIRIEQPVLINK